MGYIEKAGSTAMQSEQEKSKSNSRLGFGGLNKSRTSNSANTGSGKDVDAPQPNSNAASRDSTNDQKTATPSTISTKQSSQRGSSGKPQKGEAGYEEPHEEEHGAARGEGVPPSSQSSQSKPMQNNEQGASETQNGDNENQEQEGNDDQEGQKGPNDDIYPEQRHAGKVDGVGPEYGAANRVVRLSVLRYLNSAYIYDSSLSFVCQTVSDRLQGVKEQIKGTILRKPDVKQRGKERMTGELKKKEKEDVRSPFRSLLSLSLIIDGAYLPGEQHGPIRYCTRR